MEVCRYMYRCMWAGGSGWKCTGTCIGVCGREGVGGSVQVHV